VFKKDIKNSFCKFDFCRAACKSSFEMRSRLVTAQFILLEHKIWHRESMRDYLEVDYKYTVYLQRKREKEWWVKTGKERILIRDNLYLFLPNQDNTSFCVHQRPVQQSEHSRLFACARFWTPAAVFAIVRSGRNVNSAIIAESHYYSEIKLYF
jgi:hypothetical protein